VVRCSRVKYGVPENVVLPQAGVYTGTVVKNGRVVLKYRLTVYEADHPDQRASVEKIWPPIMAKMTHLSSMLASQ
jgi:hypothetical protein